jgi:hypothetical protein
MQSRRITSNLLVPTSYSTFNGELIWKAEAEGKHKFFTWLLLQCKILTKDKLMARNWPCNLIYELCNRHQETAVHLVLNCTFHSKYGRVLRVWTHDLVQVPAIDSDVLDWWQKALVGLPKKLRRLKAATMVYTSWNSWKARNRRVFDQQLLNVVQVIQEIKSEAFVRKMACGAPEILDPPLILPTYLEFMSFFSFM